MAGHNVEAKLNATEARLAAQIENLRWLVGGGFALLGVFLTLFRLFG